MKGKLIYLAGPITGVANDNREEFERASNVLRNLGNAVINPHELCAEIPKEGNPELVWLHCIKVCLRHLKACDMVVMLDGFKESTGSMVELTVALMCGIPTTMMREIDAAISAGIESHTHVLFNLD